MAKKNTKARLRVKLQQVTKERDLYEKKLKALSLVLANMGALLKDNDRLKKEVTILRRMRAARMRAAALDLRRRRGN